jgi:hypothetical protein
MRRGSDSRTELMDEIIRRIKIDTAVDLNIKMEKGLYDKSLPRDKWFALYRQYKAAEDSLSESDMDVYHARCIHKRRFVVE